MIFIFQDFIRIGQNRSAKIMNSISFWNWLDFLRYKHKRFFKAKVYFKEKLTMSLNSKIEIKDFSFEKDTKLNIDGNYNTNESTSTNDEETNIIIYDEYDELNEYDVHKRGNNRMLIKETTWYSSFRWV